MPDFVYVLMLLWGAAFLVCFGAFAVHLYRSEGSPQTPVGGMSTPRIVPPTGPKQPTSAPEPPDRGTGRRGPTVALGAPDPSATVPAHQEAS